MYRWIYYEKISIVRLIVYNFKKNTICWLHSVFRQKIPAPRRFQVSRAVKVLRFRYRKDPRLSSRQTLHAPLHRFPCKRKKLRRFFSGRSLFSSQTWKHFSMSLIGILMHSSYAFFFTSLNFSAILINSWTMFSIDWMQTNSYFPWALWPPAQRLGQGTPI